MKPHVVYLHGFASGPKSAKAQFLRQRLAESTASFTIPELDGGDFLNLTVQGMLDRAGAAVEASGSGKVLVVGSSLGGYVASLLLSRRKHPRIGGALLIAPAFGFTEHWATLLKNDEIDSWRRAGRREFYHFGAEKNLPLGFGFYESCKNLPAFPEPAGLPIAIVHGRHDESVAWRHSLKYAQTDERADLHLVDGDHRLSAPRHEDLIAWCANDVIGRMP